MQRHNEKENERTATTTTTTPIITTTKRRLTTIPTSNTIIMSSSSSSSSSLSKHNTTIIDASTIPLIAGFMGGVVSTTLLLPLDIVKVRLQVTESNVKNKTTKHWRSFRIVGGIIKYEGIRGLYQGWIPSVLGSSISWGGYFYCYELLKYHLVQYKIGNYNNTNTNNTTNNTTTIKASDVLTSIDNFVVAVLASSIMVGITNPIWLIKTRIQLQLKRVGQVYGVKPYNGMIDAFRTIIRDEGILALYKGVGPALLLTSHGGIQFVVYEALRKKYYHYSKYTTSTNATTTTNNNDDDTKPNVTVWQRFQLSAGYLTMGAISKLVATTVTYPLQLIKARIQQRQDTAVVELTDDGKVELVRRNNVYSNIRNTCIRIYTTEGIGGFFKGCMTNAVRVMPGAAITFVVYEEVSDLLLQQQQRI